MTEERFHDILAGVLGADVFATLMSARVSVPRITEMAVVKLFMASEVRSARAMAIRIQMRALQDDGRFTYFAV